MTKDAWNEGQNKKLATSKMAKIPFFYLNLFWSLIIVLVLKNDILIF